MEGLQLSKEERKQQLRKVGGAASSKEGGAEQGCSYLYLLHQYKHKHCHTHVNLLSIPTSWRILDLSDSLVSYPDCSPEHETSILKEGSVNIHMTII